MIHSLLWFRRLMLLGIVANLLMAIPGSFAPNVVLERFGIEPLLPHEQIWPAFACHLLVLLSIFYLPALADPLRHRTIAWLAVFARFTGVWFFLVLWDQYAVFGWFDLFWGVTQGICLMRGLRAADAMPGTRHG